MLQRVLEPEVMEEIEEVEAYDAMPHQQVNEQFVADWLAFWEPFPPTESPQLLDIGTGTGQIPLILRERAPGWRIVAVDQSEPMLRQAERNAQRAGQLEWTRWEVADACRLPYAEASFECVLSNSLVHHLPDPEPCLREALRVLRPGGGLFIRDLFRPETQAEVERLVQRHAGHEPLLAQQLLRQSLQAALTESEVRQFCARLPEADWQVEITSDRHWTLTATKPA